MRGVDSIAEFLRTAAGSANLYGAVLEPNAVGLNELNARLVAFYASNGRGYLNSIDHHILDRRLQLTQRSKIVIVRDGADRVVSTVRITPRPFEIEGLMTLDPIVGAFKEHFELSRLVSWYRVELRSLPTVLALGIALSHVTSLGARGVVALARTPQRRLFAKFGLKPTHVSPVTVPMRAGGEYWLLEASIDAVFDSAQAYCKQLRGSVSSPTHSFR